MNGHLAGDDLIEDFNKGNPRSLKRIFDHFYAPLCFFAERMVVRREDAQDIVIECFVKLWELHGRFATMQNIKAFLYITTRNACLNHIKQSERDAIRQTAIAHAQPQTTDHILSEITKAEVLREVHAAIETLPPQCRKIMRMSFVEGMKNQEIAEQLKLSVNTVKNQKVRALYLLKMKLLNPNVLAILYLHDQLVNRN